MYSKTDIVLVLVLNLFSKFLLNIEIVKWNYSRNIFKQSFFERDGVSECMFYIHSWKIFYSFSWQKSFIHLLLTIFFVCVSVVYCLYRILYKFCMP